MSTTSANAQPRVLLVDDEPAALETLAALLEEEFLVDTASSTRTALVRLRATRYDLVITDYDLGDGTGETVLRHAAESGAQSARILLTGHPDYQEVRRLQKEVEFLVLFKPVDPQELLTWVRHETTLARLHRSVSRSGRLSKLEEEEEARGLPP